MLSYQCFDKISFFIKDAAALVVVKKNVSASECCE